jgi:nitroreductase
MDAITLLTARRSSHALQAPAPDGEALETILRAALRVPDFEGLRPYEFILASGEGLDRLGALFERAAIRAGKPP